MFKRIAILSALFALPAVIGCQDVSSSEDPMGGAGGKADEIGCDAELDQLCEDEFGGGWSCNSVDAAFGDVECCIGGTCDFTALPEPEPEPEPAPDDGPTAACPSNTVVTSLANDTNDHVFSACRDADNGQFASTQCCADQIDEITAISGCPSQARFNNGSGGDKRCINDVSGSDEQGQFVPTACCAALCSPGASFDGDGFCRAGDGSGQFEEELCCHRNDNLAGASCQGAGWEQLTAGPREGDYACRNEAGRFALNACCVDLCAEAISTNPASFPGACEEAALAAAAGDECPDDAGPNSAGICHDPGNGQFVKAVCCDFAGRTQGLDRERTDGCLDGSRTDC
jgi:hypothetical protein